MSYFFSADQNVNVENLLKLELDKVSNWLSANLLSLNVKKSNFLYFTRNKKRSKPAATEKRKGRLCSQEQNWEDAIEN